MTRRINLAIAALFAGFAVTGAHAQQFAPPLNAAAPLSAPIYVELKPGAAAQCENTTKVVQGPPLFPEEKSQLSLSVAAAEGGVKLDITDQTAGAAFAIVLLDNGEVTVEARGALAQVPAEQRAMVEQILKDAFERTVLHRKTVGQGDALLEGDDIQKLGGAIMAAFTGTGADARFSGSQVVVGESASGGRRVLVYKSDLQLVMTLPDGSGEMEIIGEGYGAYDIETGLGMYDEMDMAIAFPPSTGIEAVTLKTVNNCAIAFGG